MRLCPSHSAGASHTSNARVDDFLAPSGRLACFRSRVLGSSTPSHDAWRAPAVSAPYDTYAGLPPLYISGASEDILSDDARVFAHKARDAGVDVTYTEGRHMEHGYAAAAADMVHTSHARLRPALPRDSMQRRSHTHVVMHRLPPHPHPHPPPHRIAHQTWIDLSMVTMQQQLRGDGHSIMCRGDAVRAGAYQNHLCMAHDSDMQSNVCIHPHMPHATCPMLLYSHPLTR